MEPARITFEELLEPRMCISVDSIPSAERPWFNRQKEGPTYIYNRYSSEHVRAFLFLSSYQPKLLFIVIITLNIPSKNTHQNTTYDSSSGRSMHSMHKQDCYNYPRTYVRILPDDWDDSILSNSQDSETYRDCDPFNVFNAGLEPKYSLHAYIQK
jgi:hypothetical protein